MSEARFASTAVAVTKEIRCSERVEASEPGYGFGRTWVIERFTGVPYSIQTLKRLKLEYFRKDLVALFDLLQQKKIKPLIAQRFPLAEANTRRSF